MQGKRTGRQIALLVYGIVMIAFSLVMAASSFALLGMNGLVLTFGIMDPTTIVLMKAAHAGLVRAAGILLLVSGIVGIAQGTLGIIASKEPTRLDAFAKVAIATIVLLTAALVCTALVSGDLTSTIIGIVLSGFGIWLSRELKKDAAAQQKK
jgi:hypothetical protein